MSVTVFEDLCLDACNASTHGEFWSAALDLALYQQAGGGRPRSEVTAMADRRRR